MAEVVKFESSHLRVIYHVVEREWPSAVVSNH